MCQNLQILSLIIFNIIYANSQFTIDVNGTDSVAVGAPSFYSGSYQSILSPTSTQILDWRVGNKNVARVFLETDGTTSLLNLTGTGIQSVPSVADSNSSVYYLSLELINLQLVDSGAVDIYGSLPAVGVLATFMPLNVKVCDSSSIEVGSGIDVAGIGSHPYKFELDVDCDSATHYNGSVHLTCQADATWLQEGSCVAVTTTAEVTTAEDTTTSGANSSNAEPGGLLLGAIAAIVIGGILVVLLIIHLSLGVFVGLDVVKTLLSTLIIGGLYVLGSVLSIIGIIMCSSGNLESTTDYMNGVEKAGTALGTIGLVIIIAALIKAAVTGGSKDYSAGSQ